MGFISSAAGVALDFTLHNITLAIDGLKFGVQALTSILDFLSSAMRGLAGAADVARGAINFVKGALDALEHPISTIIQLAQRLEDAFRRISGIHLPSLPSFPSIPGFAQGGIIKKDQLAMLHSPEVVIPMNDNKRALALLQQSGLLEMVARQAPAGGTAGALSGRAMGAATSALGAIAAGVSIGNISVNVTGDVSREQARATSEAIVNGIEETIKRRQLALTVRTL
jgi:hypothetical protein